MSKALPTLLLCALTAAANPIVTEQLSARHRGGCDVELTVMLYRGVKKTHLERARRHFAFESASCVQQIEIPDTSKRNHDYDVYTVVDKVCGDGKWHYRVGTIDPSELGAFGDFGATAEVDVKGCAAASACPALIEAPAKVTEQVAAPPCKVELGMGYTTPGNTQTIADKKVGKPLGGIGVVEALGTQPPQFKAIHPGLAWFALEKPSQPGGCVEFTVEPDAYKTKSLEPIEQWAYRAFDVAKARDRQTVDLAAKQRWPIPLEGTMKLPPNDPLVRMGVDDQCRPALVAVHAGNGPYFTGAELTEPNGAAHLYLINETGMLLGLPCKVNQYVTLEFGEWRPWPATLKQVAGDALFEKKGNDVRGAKLGSAYFMGTEFGSELCRMLTVVPMPKLADRIATVKRNTMATTQPIMLELKVGETRSVPFEQEQARGTGPGTFDANFDAQTKSIRFKGVRAGYGGWVAKDRDGAERFFFVTVTDPTDRR